MKPSPILFSASILILGEVCVALMGAIVKHLGDQVSLHQLVFYRNLFGLCGVSLVMLMLYYKHADFSLKTPCLRLHLLRGCAGLSAMYSFFYVIQHMALAQASLVKFTAPFIIPMIAFFWLKEPLSTRNLAAICTGFVGVMLILLPTPEIEWIAWVALSSACLMSLAKVTIRRMASEPSYRIVFYFSIFATSVSLVLFVFGKQNAVIEPIFASPHLIWLIALGALGTAGQLLITHAFRMSNPSQLAPFIYTSLVFSSLLGWLIWEETLSMIAWIGAGLIVSAGWLNLAQPKRPNDSTAA